MLPPVPLELKTSLRRAELDLLLSLTERRPASPAVVLLGPAGIGKSTLLECFRATRADRVRGWTDLGASRNRSALGVAASLLANLAPDKTRTFFELSAEARLVGGDRETRNVLTLCETILTETVRAEDVFLLDNIDRASIRVRSWLFGDLFPKIGARALCAARGLPDDLGTAETLDLLPFGTERLQKLSDFWAPFDVVDPARLRELIARESEGHPVRAEIIAWALSVAGDKADHAEKRLAALLRCAWSALPDVERVALRAAIVARYRINHDVMSALTGNGSLTSVERLPFSTPIDDDVGGCLLHPVALDLMEKEIDPAELDAERLYLADTVYPRLISGDVGDESRSVLDLERLRYFAGLSTSDGFGKVEAAFNERVLHAQLWRADEVAQIAADVRALRRGAAQVRAKLIVAENCIIHHAIAEADRELAGVGSKELSAADRVLSARVRYLRAKCITSPAATHGAKILGVAQSLDTALRDCLASKSSPDLAEAIRFELGQAHRLAGRYEQALDCYQLIEGQASNPSARVRAIEEQAQLYRHMQDLESAEAAYGRAALMRIEMDIPITGEGLYGLGSLKRDQNDFTSAERYYQRALQLATSESDDYLVCTITGDRAWMKYVSGDLENFKTLLNDYQRLAELYGFSRELAELWHMRYHLNVEEDNWPDAYACLSTAAELAKASGNIVMQLDCQMHLVQRATKEGRLPDAEQLIAEMLDIEQRGCGIRVFRGRARIYQGDGLLSAHHDREALLAWLDGFEIVAGYGHSKTSVELLEGLVADRRARFQTVAEKFPDLAGDWPQSCASPVRERIQLALCG